MARRLLFRTGIMRILSSALVAATLVLAAAHTAQARGEAQPSHPFGLGIMLGVPTDLEVKYYLKNKMAIDGGIGGGSGYDTYYGRGYDNALDIHADVLWHPVVLTRQPAFTMPLYFGVGARLLQWSFREYNNNGTIVYRYDDTHLGVRAPIGILMDFNNTPIDVFLEFALVFDFLITNNDNRVVADDNRIDENLSIGIRYYF